MTDRYVLLGGSVSGSPTPKMMCAAMGALGLDAVYEASSVAPAELGNAFAALRKAGVSGANVTIPHKAAITRFLDSLDGAASETGAVNTLKRDGEGYKGYNTDVDGILGPLASRGLTAIGHATVIGTGGAARAFCKAMHVMGCSGIDVVSRDPVRAGGFVSSMRAAFPSMVIEFASAEVGPTRTSEILFNASPSGANGVPLPGGATRLLQGRPVVFDAVYAPVETDLTMLARRLGCDVIYGHEMLLHQGLRSLEIWTGRDPPVQVMRSALLDALGVPSA